MTNLIGISGKIGSGKDTVGNIIQYLTSSRTYDKSFLEWEELLSKEPNHGRWYAGYCNWKIKKYADKLKDMVCLLIGCSREQLEDRKFKETELGAEWWYWRAYDDGSLFAYTGQNMDIKYWELVKTTPRLLLQLLGTEAGRQIIHPNIWVNSLFTDYKALPKGKAHDLVDWSELYSHNGCKNCRKSYKGYKRQYLCKTCIEDDSVQEYPNWIITDVRFPNELESIVARKGITIRINRDKGKTVIPNSNWGSNSCTIDKAVVEEDYGDGEYLIKSNCGKTLNVYNYEVDFEGESHASETSLDRAAFTYTIVNNGTMEELIEKVKQILIKEKILWENKTT